MQTRKMVEEDICQVDMYVKSQVVTDSIKLAKKKDCSKTKQLGSLT